MARKKSRRKTGQSAPHGERQRRRNRAANETRLAPRAKAFAEAQAEVELEREFDRRYEEAKRLAELCEAEQNPDNHLALLGYHEEFAQWMKETGADKHASPERTKAIKDLNDRLYKNIEMRLGQLDKPDRTEEEEAEWQGWHRLHVRMRKHDLDKTTELRDRLAAEGLRIQHGKDEDGQDIVWTEKVDELTEPPPLRTRPTRHAHWEEVVDLQDEMIRFWYTEFGRAYGRAWGQSIIDAGAADISRVHAQQKPGSEPWRPEHDSNWALDIDALNRVVLQLASPMWVSPDVKAMVEFAAKHETYKREPLQVTDVFPSLHGFCLFPEPFYVTDDKGKQLGFRAISWMPIGKGGEFSYTMEDRITPDRAGGILLMAYSHTDDWDDYPILPDTMDPDELNDLKFKKSDLPTMAMCYVTPWTFNDQKGVIDMTGSGLHEFCNIVQTLWRFAKQMVIVPEGNRLPRAARKRAERSGLISDVVVMKLRRKKSKASKENEGTGAKLTNRHWVGLGNGGFWRDQWYPKEQVHKQIWIMPFLQGPEDAPIIYKPMKAYEITQ